MLVPDRAPAHLAIPTIMKNYLRSILLALAVTVGALAATATGTVIHVDVTSLEKMTVENQAASLATLTTVVGSLVKDKDHTAVEIKVPANLDSAKVEQIKAACRKTGIYLVSIATKS